MTRTHWILAVAAICATQCPLAGANEPTLPEILNRISGLLTQYEALDGDRMCDEMVTEESERAGGYSVRGVISQTKICEINRQDARYAAKDARERIAHSQNAVDLLRLYSDLRRVDDRLNDMWLQLPVGSASSMKVGALGGLGGLSEARSRLYDVLYQRIGDLETNARRCKQP
jgi:hypothetical protein